MTSWSPQLLKPACDHTPDYIGASYYLPGTGIVCIRCGAVVADVQGHRHSSIHQRIANIRARYADQSKEEKP